MEEISKKKKDEFLKEYVKLRYNISKVCKALNIGRQTYYNWIKSDDSFAEKVVNAKQGSIDDIEDILIKIAFGYSTFQTKTVTKETAEGVRTVTTTNEVYHSPNFSAIKLFLEAYARDRGYGMKPDESDRDDF